VLSEYPSVETFTVQSAFKYDNPTEEVIAAIKRIRAFVRHPIEDFEEDFTLEVIRKTSLEYQRTVEGLAETINLLARYVPRRRMRKLHIGLFGYSRRIGKVSLPRAIGFCSACYSMGLPPEILGLGAMSSQELRALESTYKNLRIDLALALRYFNARVFEILPEEAKESILKALDLASTLDLSVEEDPDHKEVTARVIRAVKNQNYGVLPELIVEAGLLRRFLG